MEQKLRNLYNAMLKIETKGTSTVQMAECLRYTELMIQEAHETDAELESFKEKKRTAKNS